MVQLTVVIFIHTVSFISAFDISKLTRNSYLLAGDDDTYSDDECELDSEESTEDDDNESE